MKNTFIYILCACRFCPIFQKKPAADLKTAKFKSRLQKSSSLKSARLKTVPLILRARWRPTSFLIENRVGYTLKYLEIRESN